MIGKEKDVLPQAQNIVGTAIHENGITTYWKIINIIHHKPYSNNETDRKNCTIPLTCTNS